MRMSRIALVGAVVGCGSAMYGGPPVDAGNDVTYAPPYGIAPMPDAGPDAQKDGASDAGSDAPNDSSNEHD